MVAANEKWASKTDTDKVVTVQWVNNCDRVCFKADWYARGFCIAKTATFLKRFEKLSVQASEEKPLMTEIPLDPWVAVKDGPVWVVQRKASGEVLSRKSHNLRQGPITHEARFKSKSGAERKARTLNKTSDNEREEKP